MINKPQALANFTYLNLSSRYLQSYNADMWCNKGRVGKGSKVILLVQ